MNDVSMTARSNEKILDLRSLSVRQVNTALRSEGTSVFRVRHPLGAHALGCGMNREMQITIEGHVGYYCAGMNQEADILIEGNAGTGLAENIMSGIVRVLGDASQSVAASGHGGLVVVEGNASARCGIAMKGVEIVIGGDVGHMAAFMAQSGVMAICGDAADDLGDSIYEAQVFVRGEVASLGADCIEKKMHPEHVRNLQHLLNRAGVKEKAESFRRYGSARKLYNFVVDNAGAI